MTVVAALADIQSGRVVMAADTASQYHSVTIQGARKIRRLKTGDGREFLLAASGNGALAQVTPRLLEVAATPYAGETMPDEQAWDEWAEIIASAVTEILADLKPAMTLPAPDGGTVIDGAFLLGTAGRLWYLFTHQALRVADGRAALGSGSDLALGALAALAGPARGMLHDAVTEAVDIACRYDPWCSIGDGSAQTEWVK